MAEQTAQLSEKLRLAASKGQIDYIQELVQSGARFIPDKYGRTALHYAANYGQTEAVKLCIYLGCELDAQDVYGCTALHRAVIDAHIDAIKALLLEGCAVDRQDENGNTALHEAAWTGFDEAVQTLVKEGRANLHASNKHGSKPLHQSCQNGHSETTRILLRSGAHPNVKNNHGETPLHIAALFGHITCCRILISANINVNITNAEGNTALHVAAGLGKKKISKILLEASIDFNVKNDNGETALEVARQNDHVEVVILILATVKLQSNKSSHHRSQHRSRGTSCDRDEEKTELTHSHKQNAGSNQPGSLRVKGRRELREQTNEQQVHNQNNTDGGKKRHEKRSLAVKKSTPSTSRPAHSSKHVTFVKEELKNTVLWEKQLHHQIHRVNLKDVRGKGHHHRNNHQLCLYKNESGHVSKGTTSSVCSCSIYIHKLQNQLEASKEKMLYEIDTTRAQFQHKLGLLDKKLTHQGSCVDQLCKERISSERTQCLHRIDRRMLQERALWSEEYERRLSYVRDELRRYFEVRLRTVQQQLAVYYPRDNREPLHGNPSGFERISEGTEESSGSDPSKRDTAKPEIIGPNRKIFTRRTLSVSPALSPRIASADGRQTRSNHDRSNKGMNGERPEQAYKPGLYSEDNRGRSQTVIRGTRSRGRTGSFTRAVQHLDDSNGPKLQDDKHSTKELVSATYIPPIAHPDLPHTSKPREPANFILKSNSSSDESSESTVRLPDKQPPSTGPLQHLSKTVLKQKAYYEEHLTRQAQSDQESDGANGQLTHSAAARPQHQHVNSNTRNTQGYSNNSEVTTNSSANHKDGHQPSPVSVSTSSSDYNPSQCQYSQSSSGVSSGDGGTVSSKQSRRNPIDDVLIRALSMEREHASNTSMGAGTFNNTGLSRPLTNQIPSAYVKGF